ncbi:MAG: 2,3-diphosphoglycerate synthetase [Thermoleophilia bacterium]|nr:2,3-diphosphoglycerate synthetase [Thermoleophilia bacterium]
MRALALIDGEHYAPVVRDALAALPYEVVGALLVGGTEKLRGGAPGAAGARSSGRPSSASPATLPAEDYGVPLVDALDAVEADLVVDLSDEPVLGPRERLLWASRALALGLPYVGADFRFDPPRYHPFELPSLAVVGTGKRIGKTAVTGHVARLLARDRDVVVVAMGRGGPPEPEVLRAPPTVAELVELARSGRHAASDHLETAALVGVPTVGCRRAGGGMAGAPFDSNVLEGARVAASLGPDVVVFDGSGAAIPPIAADVRVLVAHDLSGLNAYRALVSDVVLAASEEVAEAARALGRPTIRFSLRLRPVEPLEGRVAVFTTGPAPVAHLDADVVFCSRSLARRDELEAQLETLDADTYLVELKAAAIDLVAEDALARGRRVVLAENEVVPLPGEPDLDAFLLDRLAPPGSRT